MPGNGDHQRFVAASLRQPVTELSERKRIRYPIRPEMGARRRVIDEDSDRVRGNATFAQHVDGEDDVVEVARLFRRGNERPIGVACRDFGAALDVPRSRQT